MGGIQGLHDLSRKQLQGRSAFHKGLVTKLLPASEDLAASLEEQSVYWNDDLPFVSSMIRNSLSKFREHDDGRNDIHASALHQ
jgi:transcription antitermination protein NusB